MFWQNKLSDFMKKEHEKMEILLTKLNSTPKDIEIFNELKEILENHVYAEEKATRMLHKNGNIFPALSDVIEQHTKIEDCLKELKSDLNIKIKLKKIQILAQLLKSHLAYEEKEFYPYLDTYLNREDKKEIFDILKTNLN